MKSALVLYVPVLHEGYLKLFEKYRGSVDTLYIFDKDIIEEFSPLHNEIRALDPSIAAHLIQSLELFGEINVLEKKRLKKDLPQLKKTRLIVADDELSRSFVKKYLPHSSVAFETVFLHWDEKNVNSSKTPKGVKVSRVAFDRKIMTAMAKEGVKSSDWWRHVGGAIVRGRKIILSGHNRHVPSEHVPYIDGDPRDVVPAGTQSHLATAMHAEQWLIAEAAKRGLKLNGANMYINVFPCAVCAKLIAYSGIKKCFFASGHASLDGERVLKANGVEIIAVK